MVQAGTDKLWQGGIRVNLDTCDLQGRCSAILSDSKLQIGWSGQATTLAWLPDGRIVFARVEPPPNDWDSNLWSIEVDPDTGRPLGSPKRLTNWIGFSQFNLAGSADGRRVAFQQAHPESIVKIAEIRADGGGLGPARPLNSESWRSYPEAWTRDSKTVLFYARSYGKATMFRQDVDARNPEVLISGSGKIDTIVISPDGKWFLYVEHLEDGTARLLRVPIEGGASTLVLPGDYDYRCASAPASLCVVSEFSAEQMVFYVLDLLNGRGRELARADVKSQGNWSLSPDGKNIALANGSDQVRILSTYKDDVRSLPLKGWSNLQFANWTADGNHLYLSGLQVLGTSLPEWAILESDLAGNVKVLTQIPYNEGWLANPNPSPDGRHLIFLERTWPSSVMMLENF